MFLVATNFSSLRCDRQDILTSDSPFLLLTHLKVGCFFLTQKPELLMFFFDFLIQQFPVPARRFCFGMLAAEV